MYLVSYAGDSQQHAAKAIFPVNSVWMIELYKGMLFMGSVYIAGPFKTKLWCKIDRKNLITSNQSCPINYTYKYYTSIGICLIKLIGEGEFCPANCNFCPIIDR